MSWIDSLLLAVALAMDCTAVSMSCGILQRRMDWPQLIRMAGLFGFFQAGMPVLGWIVSYSFYSYVEAFAAWIALLLLLGIGGKIVWDSFQHRDVPLFNPHSLRALLLLAVATSIDAMAIGISFTCMQLLHFRDIFWIVVVIGFTSFLFSIVGKWIGVFIGQRISWNAERLGGIILILLGIKLFFGF